RSAIPFSAYEALDRKVFSGPGDALEQVDVSSALEGVATVQLPAPAVQEPLDVLVCLGTGLAPAQIPLTPRHGVWTLHLGAQHRYQGEPAVSWELYFANPASSSVLEAVGGNGGQRRVLYRSWAATDPVSLQRTRNPVYWKSARFTLRRLRDLAAGRWS